MNNVMFVMISLIGFAKCADKFFSEIRAVIYLYYIQGYDTAEIARILDVPQNTVLSRMARARKQLKTMLEGGMDDV